KLTTEHTGRPLVVARERDLGSLRGQRADRSAKARRELWRDLDVDQPGESVRAEQPALPRARPDDRFVHHGAGLDLFVRPDPDVGVDARAGADRDVAADHASLFEQASVLDRDGAADDRAAKARV